MPGTPFRKHNTRAGKLTPGQVQTIRELYAGGRISQGQLARDYGVGIGQIGRIVRGEAWQDIVSPVVSPEAIQESLGRLLQVQQEKDAQTRMEEDIAKAKEERTPGRTQADRMIEELGEETAERLRQLKGE